MELNHTSIIMRYSNTIYVLITLVLLLSSCQSEYEKAVQKGLDSKEIYEELLFDMTMGQTKKEFYARCWDLNKEKKISQGNGNQYAKYIMSSGELFDVPEEVEMLFYGIFDEDNIMRGMDMRFNYTKWSPWNEEFHSDMLIEKLKAHYMNEYAGNEFINFDSGVEGHSSYVKVDGNRQILLYQLSNKDVSVKIEDLRHKPMNL